MAIPQLDYRKNPRLAEINPVLSAQFVHTVLVPSLGEELSAAEVRNIFDFWRKENGLPYALPGQVSYWLGREIHKAGFEYEDRPNRVYLNIAAEPPQRRPFLREMKLPINVNAPASVIARIVPVPADTPELECNIVPELDIDAFIKQHISVNDAGRIYRSDVVKCYRFWLREKTGLSIQVDTQGPQMKRFDFIVRSQGFMVRSEGATMIFGLLLTPPEGVPGLRRSAAAPKMTNLPFVYNPSDELVQEFISENLEITGSHEDHLFPDDVLERVEKWLSEKFEQDVKVDFSSRIYQKIGSQLKRKGSWGYRHGLRAYREIKMKD